MTLRYFDANRLTVILLGLLGFVGLRSQKLAESLGPPMAIKEKQPDETGGNMENELRWASFTIFRMIRSGFIDS